MNADHNEEQPMWGTWDNLYYGLDTPERKEVPFTLMENFKRFLTNNRWYVEGEKLINKRLNIVEDFNGQIPHHVCGFPMWKLQDLADKRNKFKTYYWAGWHTQKV